MKTALCVLVVAVLGLGLGAVGCGSSNGDDDPGVDTAGPGDDTTGPGDDTSGPGDDTTEPEADLAEAPDQVADPCLELCQTVECGAVDDCACGGCEAGSACEANLCVCQPDCTDKVCGPDGCGGVCGACDEGTCYQGVCIDICFPPGVALYFSDVVFKINHLEIGEGGYPGYAVDVDGDPGTCAPLGACQDGLDNGVGGLLENLAQYIDANAEIATALDEGTIILLAEFVDMALDGSAFLVNFYLGVAVDDKATCDWQVEPCDYLADVASFNPIDCDPLISFGNATITDGAFAAGGPDDIFSVTIPLDVGLVLTANAYMARLLATPVIDGGMVLALNDGVVGGAIDKAELLETCMALPEDLFAELGIGKELVCNMLDMFIQPDIDRDDDGELDSASVGIAFGAIPGTITGLYENLLE
ncbi:MAG: hypothetical protein ABIK09_08330 [Pseudomonadota bacterium]